MLKTGFHVEQLSGGVRSATSTVHSCRPTHTESTAGITLTSQLSATYDPHLVPLGIPNDAKVILEMIWFVFVQLSTAVAPDTGAAVVVAIRVVVVVVAAVLVVVLVPLYATVLRVVVVVVLVVVVTVVVVVVALKAATRAQDVPTEPGRFKNVQVSKIKRIKK